MSIRKFSTATISTGNSKSTKLWDQETFQSGMFALATVSLTSTASSVVFSGIPSNYTHLQLRCMSRSTAGGINAVCLQFNSDTGSNYADHRVEGNGASAYTDKNISAVRSVSGLQAGSTTGANIFGAVVIDVLDYASTSKYKTIRALGGVDNNGSGNIAFGSGLWMSTSAISSITIVPENTSFAANSHFALYGIKAAS